MWHLGTRFAGGLGFTVALDDLKISSLRDSMIF